MRRCSRPADRVVLCALLILPVSAPAWAQEVRRLIFPEQRRMQIRDPSQMRQARLPRLPAPATVLAPRPQGEAWRVSLDEAIRIALGNSEVVRVLSGTTAAASGSTIYDPAIANTDVDQSRAVFDPSIQVQNQFQRLDRPVASLDPNDPSKAILGGTPAHDYNMTMQLSKQLATGAQADFRVNTNPTRRAAAGLPLNPETSSLFELGLTQPLLQGAGAAVNLAPIVIARIDTERSFFQMKDSVQRMVRGVIEAYWALVFARTDVWVLQQQVKQTRFAHDRAQARMNKGLADIADVAQAGAALASFRAGLVTAEASVLEREAALRNLLGLPFSQRLALVPVTPPRTQQLETDWEGLLQLAEQYRPDLIELKLNLEADEQRLAQAHNQAMPRVDANALYRFNGLAGTAPNGSPLASHPGQFDDWQLGVNVSLPLGQRQSRAALRQQELVIMRDRANLQQGLHSVTHLLAQSYRNLAQFYREYLAFGQARVASRENLTVQLETYRQGLTDYLNVLQAITSWGDALSAEARALLQYNTELSNLQQQTGTILEAHAVRFAEERYGSVGPLGRAFPPRCYPRDVRPCPNVDRYPATDEPAENVFDLDAPSLRRKPGAAVANPAQPSPAMPASPAPPAPPGPERLQLHVPARPETIPTPTPHR